MEGIGAGFRPPTQRIGENCDIDLDGIAARLIHAPGETEDHMMVWLPDQRVLFSATPGLTPFPTSMPSVARPTAIFRPGRIALS